MPPVSLPASMLSLLIMRICFFLEKRTKALLGLRADTYKLRMGGMYAFIQHDSSKSF